jgi:hypothetical protein
MVGAPGSPASPPRGSAVDVSCVDGGRSRIFSIASQGGPSSTFLTLMVGASGSLAPPPREPAVDAFCVDGGRSRISGIVSQGAHHRRFLCWWWALLDLRHRLSGVPLSTFFALMVSAPRSPASPSRGSAVEVYCVDGGHSRISCITS